MGICRIHKRNLNHYLKGKKEKKIHNIILKTNSVPEWDGITQTMPMELQCKEALRSRDIYMYFGHSAGQAFMRGGTVRQLPKCAVSLLMGCSSGVLEANGEFDPHGYVLNYLLAGR